MITARHRNVALLVAGCYFMEMLDGTIVVTAAPQIGRSLHATATAVGLVVTAYLLTLAVLIPLSGWLTRRYGNRLVFLTAIALFTLASVGCAASVSLGMLVAMRVLQGAGGTMYFFVVGAMPFLLPLMFEVQFGWSPVKSGAVTAFVFAGNVGIKPATTPLINRFGFRPLLVASTLGTAVIVAALGFTTASTPVAVTAALALASGVTRSAGFTVYSTVGLADMAPELMRDANTLAATSMQLGAGLAIAGATVALRAGDAVTGGGQPAFTLAFCLLALVAVGCAVEALRLDPAAGNAARRVRATAPAASAAASGRTE